MDNNQLLQVKQALDEAIAQKKLSQELLRNLGPAVIDTLRPVLDEIAKNAKLSKEELLSVLSQIKFDVPKADVPQAEVKVTIPDIVVPEPKVTVNVDAPKIPEIKIPKIVVPKPEVTVNVPPIKIPDLQWPKDKMPIEGWVQLMGVSLQNPLPVQIRDANGKPVDFAGNITQVMGGGGGKADFFTIKGFSQSAFADYLNADGRLKVSVETGGSGLTDNELRATAVPVSQVSGAMWSVSVKDAFQTTIASTLINGDDRLRVSLETGGSGLTDSELRASAIPVAQVSGASWSTEATIASVIGVVSTVNSSSTPLGIGGVFTGTSEDVKDYGSIIIATKSDVASATNGLSIQFSTDGTNWDHIDPHTIPAATSHTLTIAPQARYFRIVYTNGGTIQASFRLQAIFRSTAVGPQMETLSGDVSDTNFALTTRAVNAAKKPNGDYVNIQATAAGNLKVSIEEQDAGAGLATSAKQDTLLTELQLKADLTETQPVSLASVPSHAVTNAGTFAVQNDAATPAGTNAIGKLLPPDVDVTTHTNYIRKYYTSAGAATDGIVWSPAAGKRWHIVALHFQVSAAATVTFEDDKAAGDDPVLKGEYAANGGEFLVFPEKYPMASGEDAADFLVTTSAGNIYITCIGYEI